MNNHEPFLLELHYYWHIPAKRYEKMFSQRAKGKGVYTFTLMNSLAAMLFFIISSPNLQWNPGLLPYSLIFAGSYAVAYIFSTAAVVYGPLSLTSLIVSFSLMIPTFYGLLFLKEPIGPGLFPGLAFLSLSLILINKRSKDSPLTPKWFLCVLLAFIGNGMCSVSQKMQQNAFKGAYKNEFMILALIAVVVIMAVTIFKKEREDVREYAKNGWHLALLCGTVNGIVNLFVMILSDMISVSLMFPLISVGGIVLTFFISKFVYKEKLNKAQYAGFLAGVISIVFLNL